MEKFRVDVVGLSHNDVRDRWLEYVSKAVGKQLVMQPQPENVADPYAVRVREGRLHVGYVAVSDLDVVYQALKGSGLTRLRGTVVERVTGQAEPGVMTEHVSDPSVLCVEVEVERIDWDYEPFDDSVYEHWHYDGISLMPKRLEQLADLTVDLLDELEREAPNQGTGLPPDRTNPSPLLEPLNQLLSSHFYDVSREMTRARYRLERLLSASGDADLQAVATKLRWHKGLVMSHASRDAVARYLFVELPRQLRNRGLESSHYTYDNRLDELEAQLRAFPFHLYDKFLNDPVDFLREVYYHHVPRRHLFALLSGIALMIMKGRVKIAKWGREGDTEPITQIEQLSQPSLDSADREQAIRDGLRELLQRHDPADRSHARANLIISYKSQWAAIMSILCWDYDCVTDDMREFCRLMDSWGFCDATAYPVPCDYESLCKASDYATRPFSSWRGSGTAHKRQVLAATELREILRQKIGWK